MHSNDEQKVYREVLLEEESKTGQEEQCLLATIGGELYGLNLLAIREILRSAEKETAPGAPPFVAGLINLRGNIVTVIDAACLLGVRQRADVSDDPRIIVVEGGGEVVGVQVDSLREIVEYDPAIVQRPQSVTNSHGYDYVQGVFTKEDGELVILLDIDLLCTDRAETTPINV